MKQLKIESIIFEKDVDQIKRKYLDMIDDDEEIQAFLRENEVSEENLYNNLSYLVRYLEAKKKCKDCISLDSCPLQSKGIKPMLAIDDLGQISLKYSRCKNNYFTDKLYENFIFHDFDDSILKYNLSDAFDEDFIQARRPLLIYLTKIFEQDLIKGAYVYGDRKIGKSFILTMFCKRYINKKSKKVGFINFPALIADLVEIYYQSKEDFNTLLDKIINLDLVVFDDFGNEYATVYARDNIIYPLLDGRAKKNKLTMFTSNYSLSQIANIYVLKERTRYKGEQIAELVRSLAKEFKIESLPYLR